MTRSASTALLAGILLALAAARAAAHGGEDHSHEAAPAPAAAVQATAARRLADGSLFVPKAIQHQLGLRTLPAQVADLAATVELNGTVIADPNASGRVQSGQAGRIEPGPDGLPVPGQRVAEGQVLARLRPIAASIERGNQQAALAELEAQLAVARQRVARYRQLEDAVPRKEIEAAAIELAGLERRRAAVAASLQASEALVSPVAGVISVAGAVAGQVVEAKEVLFEVVDPERLAVEALAYDPALAGAIATASAMLPGGGRLDLLFVGGGLHLREQALPLFFRVVPTGSAVAVGQPVKVIAGTTRTRAGVALPLSAVVRNGAGEQVVWIHSDAERFTPRPVRFDALDATRVVVTAGVAGGERVVTDGATLLAQVR